jgi:hypothetical protein
VKRLLVAGAIAGTALAGFAQPANATIVICDNMPVMVGCFWMGAPGGPRRCTVYVAGIGCVEDAIKTGGVSVQL